MQQAVFVSHQVFVEVYFFFKLKNYFHYFILIIFNKLMDLVLLFINLSFYKLFLYIKYIYSKIK